MEGQEDQEEHADPGDEDGEGKRFPWEDADEEDDRPGVVARNLDELGEEAAEDGRALQRGRSIEIFGTSLPLRLIGAISVFVGVFVGVYLLTWAALGDIGLAVGLFLAAIVAVIAVKLFASLAATSAPG